MDKKNLIWLASYPKSGNTWVRILLANYLNTENKPIDINQINTSIISSSRSIFDNSTAFLASELKHDEVDILRPEVYKKISEEADDIVYIKTHDANTENIQGQNIFPSEITKTIIHIVRNPLDVAVSFAHHSNISIDKSVEKLNINQKLANGKKALNQQLRQILLNWSEHYLSWTDTNTSYLLVKYEDLLKNTEAEFRKIILHIYNEVDDTQIKNAVKQSSFKNLKSQEESGNFKERAVNSKAFFRKGIAGSWKEEMNKNQIEKVINKHKKTMIELGYLGN